MAISFQFRIQRGITPHSRWVGVLFRVQRGSFRIQRGSLPPCRGGSRSEPESSLPPPMEVRCWFAIVTNGFVSVSYGKIYFVVENLFLKILQLNRNWNFGVSNIGPHLKFIRGHLGLRASGAAGCGTVGLRAAGLRGCGLRASGALGRTLMVGLSWGLGTAKISFIHGS